MASIKKLKSVGLTFLFSVLCLAAFTPLVNGESLSLQLIVIYYNAAAFTHFNISAYKYYNNLRYQHNLATCKCTH